nr:hypothetical protein [Trinickia acidisoli]
MRPDTFGSGLRFSFGFVRWRLTLVVRGFVLSGGRRRLESRLAGNSMLARVRIEQVLASVEDLMTVSAACEPTGACEQCFLHAENRFAVGAAGG